MRRGGRVVYYGRERQVRFDHLREKGFTINESRELSRITHPNDLAVLRNMIAGRQTYVRAFKQESARQRWTKGQRRYYYYAGLREKYRKAGLDKKPNPSMAYWHMYENRLARKRGWQKGTYDPDQPDAPRVRRRRKPKYPDRHKGQVKAQKARARARGRAFKDHIVRTDSGMPRKVPLQRLEIWLRDSEAVPSQTGEKGRIQREFRSQLRRRITKAKTERAAGRDAVA